MRIHVFEEFYVHKSCFVIDYVHKREFTENYVTSFVLVGHLQGSYDLVVVFYNVFVIFPQCDDGFSNDCGFLSYGGAVT